MSKDSQRGAAAVEFALVLPVLVLLVMGIMELGRAYNAKITLTEAAREGVRAMAINNSQTAAKTVAQSAASALYPRLGDSDFSFSSNNCVIGSPVTVTISYKFSTLTGIAGPFTLTGTGTMLCGG
jgi:Flp pilus assembly protein TadG